MPTDFDALTRLLHRSTEAAPAASAKSPTALSTTRQKQLGHQLWLAVDSNDLPLLHATLQQGIDPNLPLRDKSKTLLAHTLEHNQWEQAEALITAGAAFAAPGLPNDSWKAISKRDDVREAERLLAWGAPPPRIVDFTSRARAPRLFVWGLERGFTASLPALGHNDPYLTSVFRAGMEGGPTVMQHLNAFWGIDGQDPFALAKACRPPDRRALASAWQMTLEADIPTQAHQAFTLGWGWSKEEIVAGAIASTFGWHCAHHKALKTLAWWHSEPALKTADLEATRESPDSTWWPVLKQGAESLKAVLSVIDDLRVADAKGNTILHQPAQVQTLSKNQAQVFLKHCPDLFTQPNAQGKLPLDLMFQHHKEPKLASFIQATLLGQGLGAVNASRAAAPRRPRM